MYSVFLRCFNHELHNLNDSDKNKVFMFSTYFTNTQIIKNINKIESIGMVKYKYHIFINHLKSTCFRNGYNEVVMDLFSKSQRKYMALLNLKNKCMWNKVYKNAGIVNTIEFDCLDDIPNNRTIDIAEDNIIYKFSIYDLIKIINKSLTYHIELFSEPIKVKNPWTNKELSYCTLLSIYHFIHFNVHVMSMPLLLKRYYMSNFALKVFERNNEFLIKDSILKNFHNQDNTELLIYIERMIRYYNKKYVNSTINFDPTFPKQEKINIMLPFLKYYVQYRFSIDEKVRQANKAKFMYKLNCFSCSNSLTGRKIKCSFIHKLFQVSLFCHKSKKLVESFAKSKSEPIPFHLQEDIITINMPSSKNTYPIPSLDMIDINNACYWIGKKNIYDYTLFIDVNKIPSSNYVANTNRKEDTEASTTQTFRTYVKNYVFNTSHLFYLDKYLQHYVSLNKQIFKKISRPSVLLRHTSENSNSNQGIHHGTINNEEMTLTTHERPSTPTLDSDDDSDTDNAGDIHRRSTQYLHHYVNVVAPQSRIMQYHGSNIGENYSSDEDDDDEDDDDDVDDEVEGNEDIEDNIYGNYNHEDYEETESIIVPGNYQLNEREFEEFESDTVTSDTASITYTVTRMQIDNNYENEIYGYESTESEEEILDVEEEHTNSANTSIANSPINENREHNGATTVPSPQLLDEIFGYDTDNSATSPPYHISHSHIGHIDDEDVDHFETVNTSFDQYDLHLLQERIINSLPPSSLSIETTTTIQSPIQTVFRPIDMERVNVLTPINARSSRMNSREQCESHTVLFRQDSGSGN